MSHRTPAYLVYDGDCPFCSRYVRMLRLREAIGPVELVNARIEHPIHQLLRERNVNLDEGMALVQGDQISVGDDCIHKLALMTTSVDAFNRLNGWLFKSERFSKALYPILRTGRNVTLHILGRRNLAAGGRSFRP
jgi:predicted DCC family thiol-disulfide oxidoreductase YuxK